MSAIRGVEIASCIATKRLVTIGRVMFPVVFLESAEKPSAVLWNPVVFAKSAFQPVAAFWNPVVLANSAPKPTAVLLLPVVS
jgi:hypothetical protein